MAVIRDPALLEFRNGLNVVRGVSDTGKSFVVNAIDFLLGARLPLRDMPERNGYDKARLVLGLSTEETITLERSVDGGHFRRFEGTWLTGDPQDEGITLREKHAAGREDTLSHLLLSSVNLENQLVRTNAQGKTQSLEL